MPWVALEYCIGWDITSNNDSAKDLNLTDIKETMTEDKNEKTYYLSHKKERHFS